MNEIHLPSATASSAFPTVDVDPFSRASLMNPVAQHARLRDAGPVIWIPRWKIYGIARYAEVLAALTNWQGLTSERGVGLSDFDHEAPWRPKSLLLETDPPEHDRMRTVANKVISPRSLKIVREAWRKEAEQLIDELIARGRFDAVKDLAEVFPQRVFAETIGLRVDGRDNLIPYATANFNAFGPRNSVFESTEKQRLDAAPWIEESCTRAFIRPDSWGAAFFAAADAGECSEAEAARLVRSMITAGFDTTINGLAHLIDAMCETPSAWAELRENPSLVKRAFDEAVRWASPVQTFFRTTTADLQIAQCSIPAGSKVLLFLGAANRDPRHWENPDAFVLGRQTSGHVGFGFGVHQCLGQMVARLEGEVILQALVQKVAGLRKTGPVVRRPNNTLHALAHLPVEIASI